MTVVASDAFTDTATTVLSSHAPTLGTAWAKQGTSSNAVISNANRVRNGATGPALWTMTSALAVADYDVSITINQQSASGQCGVVGRLVDKDNFYLANRTTTQWQLYRVVSAGFTTLASNVTAALVEGDKMTLRMVGDQISLLVNDVVTIGPVTNTVFTTQGLPGIRWDSAATDSTGYHGDDFVVGEIATPPADGDGGSNRMMMGVGI